MGTTGTGRPGLELALALASTLLALLAVEAVLRASHPFGFRRADNLCAVTLAAGG